MNSETIYTVALGNLQKIGLTNTRMLYDRLGSATAVWEHRNNIRDILPSATERLITALKGYDEAVKRAEAEMEYAQSKNIKILCQHDSDYPARLTECPDAPLALFYMGNADLNTRHVISIVGTRRCTQYGRELCQSLISDLSLLRPDTLIVSGLAYGIDICAHRKALAAGLPTVGVLAHGLDRIYPAPHRHTAAEMLRHGGLLTEYISGTTPEKLNFVRRNRIVAGISEATIVVESAAKGGSLITAELAQEYQRDVFAFPGRITDESSIGCNNLIYGQKATLIQSADDIVKALNWEATPSAPQPRQQELFVTLTDEQQRIVDTLQGSDGKQINQIIIDTNLSYMQVSNQLYELECMGIVTLLGGARYKLLRK